MSTEGLLYNIDKKEYFEFDIMNSQHNWEANIDLLNRLIVLISDKWKGDIIKYAYNGSAPDCTYALICFGDPYNNYKTDYKEVIIK